MRAATRQITGPRELPGPPVSFRDVPRAPVPRRDSGRADLPVIRPGDTPASVARRLA